MLENLTDDQVKALFALLVCVAPIAVSGVFYWVAEKIENRIKLRKEVRK